MRQGLEARLDGYVEATLGAAPGETIALVGPNGAGKTSLLRALAGLRSPAVARVRLDGRDLTGAPPHRRQVGYVPQDGALFPHLTALANVTYGLRAGGTRRREAERRAREWLARLGVADLAERRPGALSGGQAGRVALARALAVRPRLLLLDEPLGALDVATRTAVRHALRTHLAAYDGVCLVVTHDPVDAVALAGRMLVLESGRVVQDDAPARVTREPRSAWVARMLGRNAYLGTASDTGLTLAGGERLVSADRVPPGSPALAAIHPEAVALHLDEPKGSPRNTWAGTVAEVVPTGTRVRVAVAGRGGPAIVAEVTPASIAELRLVEGAGVWVSVKATEVRLSAV